MSVQFTPTAAGLASTTLIITTNDPPAATLRVPVSGTGGPGRLATNVSTAPTFTSSSEVLASGAVKQITPKLLSFKVKNIGTGQLPGNVGSLRERGHLKRIDRRLKRTD